MKLTEKQTRQGTPYFENECGEVISKKCTGTCGKVKPIEAFRENPIGFGGKQPQCSDCQNELTKKYDASPRGKSTHFVRSQKARIDVSQKKSGKEISNTLNVLHVQMEYGADECLYCGKSLEPHEVVLDHPIPYSRGGRNDVTNLLASCNNCNAKKGSKPLYDFLLACCDEYQIKHVVFKLSQRNGIAYEEMFERLQTEAVRG